MYAGCADRGPIRGPENQGSIGNCGDAAGRPLDEGSQGGAHCLYDECKLGGSVVHEVNFVLQWGGAGGVRWTGKKGREGSVK